MRRVIVRLVLVVGLLLAAAGCTGPQVQLWWNLNGGASNPLPADVAQVFADNINAQCHPGYWPCLRYSSDYDCAGGSGNGPSYTGPVFIIGADDYDLDADGDGLGCEDS